MNAAETFNKVLTANMFHYHVGDTISSAIKKPYFYKGNILTENNGEVLRIRLEPNRNWNMPDGHFILIKLFHNSMDEIDVEVLFSGIRKGEFFEYELLKIERLQVGDLPSLDRYISGHKAEIKERYDQAWDEVESGNIKKLNKEPEAVEAEKAQAQIADGKTTADAKNAYQDARKFTDETYKNPYELNIAIEKVIDLVKPFGAKEVPQDIKEFISQYSGFGGLEKYNKEKATGFLDEFYTPDPIIQKMWGLAYKHGYLYGGSVLEPAAGTGRFLKYAGKTARILAMERNQYSAFIAESLYSNAEVRRAYFETLFIQNNRSIKGKLDNVEKFDLVIGNPPYKEFLGKYAGMGEKDYSHATNYIDYFILRGLDVTKQGGLLIYIIGTEVAIGGKPFLDKPMYKTKEMIAERGELIDAYRLPNDVFDRTSALTDIIVFRKK